jgi:hypothetical protein
MNLIQKQLIKFLLGRFGPVLQKILTALAASVAAWIALKVPFVAEHLNAEVLLGIFWAAIDVVVTRLPADIIKDYGKQLQDMLNKAGAGLKVDGFVGPITVAQARNLVK